MKITGIRGFRARLVWATTITTLVLTPAAPRAEQPNATEGPVSQQSAVPAPLQPSDSDQGAVRIRDWQFTPPNPLSGPAAMVQGPPPMLKQSELDRIPVKPHRSGLHQLFGGVVMGVLGLYAGGYAGGFVGAAINRECGAGPGMMIGAPAGAVAGAILGVALSR